MSLSSVKRSSSANSTIVVVALARLCGREAQHDGVDQDVVACGEVGVEAHPELDERRHPPAGPDLAGVGPVDAREALHQCRLAAAVAPDDAEELARADVGGNRAQRVERLLGARAERMQHALLERVDLLVRQAERFGHVADRQRHACFGWGAHRRERSDDSLRLRDAGPPANRPWRAAPGRQPRGLPRLDAGRRAGRPAGSQCARERGGGRRPVRRRGRLGAPDRGGRARACLGPAAPGEPRVRQPGWTGGRPRLAGRGLLHRPPHDRHVVVGGRRLPRRLPPCLRPRRRGVGGLTSRSRRARRGLARARGADAGARRGRAVLGRGTGRARVAGRRPAVPVRLRPRRRLRAQEPARPDRGLPARLRA